MDEVGRGPLAGPLIAAAVILPLNRDIPWLKLVRDSKQLTPQRRECLFPLIQETALGVGIGVVTPEAIDGNGMTRANRMALRSAIEHLPRRPDFVLTDYFKLPDLKLPQKSITKGDSLCFSIACASIVAKVIRDSIMTEMDNVYPGYGFARHKGYATREHLLSLSRLGACPIHRRCFAVVREHLI